MSLGLWTVLSVISLAEVVALNYLTSAWQYSSRLGDSIFAKSKSEISQSRGIKLRLLSSNCVVARLSDQGNVKDWGDSSESRLESLVKVSEESAVGESDIWHIILHRP